MKEGARIKRKNSRPIRRVIENPDVPLPSDAWISDSDNNPDLACFLSQALMEHAPGDKCIVTAGGLREVTGAMCTRPDLNLDAIRSTHEEAGAHLVLHCAHTDSSSVIVWCRDTDVLLMLMAHSTAMDKDIYM